MIYSLWFCKHNNQNLNELSGYTNYCKNWTTMCFISNVQKGSTEYNKVYRIKQTELNSNK